MRVIPIAPREKLQKTKNPCKQMNSDGGSQLDLGGRGEESFRKKVLGTSRCILTFELVKKLNKRRSKIGQDVAVR
jgi:hypothetical protein